MKLYSMLICLLTGALLLSSCNKSAPTADLPLFPGRDLTPYLTPTHTPTVTPTPPSVPTATLEPTITPTPITYIVKPNETIWEIADRFGFTSVDEILDANPLVNPRLLSPGTVLIIPPLTVKQTVPTSVAQSSPPAPIKTQNVGCASAYSGGVYCFGELFNDLLDVIGSIGARITLTDPLTGETLAQQASIPLEYIAAGGHLPVYAYFPPPRILNPVISLQVLTAVDLAQAGLLTPKHAATVNFASPRVEFSDNGLKASVTGQATWSGGVEGAHGLQIAAVAYDANGRIVGMRRQVISDQYSTGENIPYSMMLYSSGDRIVKVELFGELLP